MSMRRSLLALFFLISQAAFGQSNSRDVVATYSIVALDSVTGDLGVAVQSKFLGVGAVVPYAMAGVGAVATQASANTTFGPRALTMLLDSEKTTAQQVVEAMIRDDSDRNHRQLGIVDADGNAYAYTGSACQPYAGHVIGRGYAVQGNILAGEQVVKAMAHTFELSQGDLADRLLAALDAGENAGGDKRGRQSAALLVVRDAGGYGGFNDRYVDIRVDDDSLPLVALRRIYEKWKGTFLLDARMRTIDEFNRERKFDAAREEMKRLAAMFNDQLKLRPDDPDLLNSIAWTLATPH